MAIKFRPTPLFWGLLGGTTAVSALTAVVLSLFNDDASAAPEAEPVEQTAEEIYNEGSTQKSGRFPEIVNGRQYVIWNGHVVESPIEASITDQDGSGTDTIYFEHTMYNFDLRRIFYLSGTSEGGLVSDRFDDVVANEQGSSHIEAVREIGCSIADEFIERANTTDHGPPPADVLRFDELHCDIAEP